MHITYAYFHKDDFDKALVYFEKAKSVRKKK